MASPLAAPNAPNGPNALRRRATGRRRIPPNLFSIAFGLAGLADAWQAAAAQLSIPHAVPDALYVVAAIAWLVLSTAYLTQGARQVLADLRHPVLGPFVSLSVITPMIPAAALANDARGAARVLVIIFLVATIVLGGWLTGQWMTGTLGPDAIHPGHFLPTVAGGLVGAFAAAAVGLPGIAEMSFGIGVVCYALLSSTVLNRLFTRPVLPAALVPTLAIELAPPAVGGIAYFAINGGQANTVAAVFGGYTVLMAVVQVRLIPLFRGLSFGPGFWAFTFSYSAAAGYAIEWITIKHPPGATAYTITVITLISAFVATIAARSVLAVARGQFLAPPAASPPVPGR